MAQPQADQIEVRCSCGAKLRVPATAAGRRGKCPKCGSVFTVPTPEPALEPAGVAADESDSLLDDLANLERSAPSAAAPPAPAGGAGAYGGGGILMMCPGCGAGLAAGAALCTSCGYDLKSGKRRKVAAATSGSGGGRSAAILAGTFALGCVFSGVGALIGAGIWFGVALALELQIGWIAWGLGALAGLGMHLGFRAGGQIPGLVAAGIATGGILAAKFAIFVFLLYTIVTGDTESVELQRHFIAYTRSEEELADRGIVTKKQREAEWDAIYQGHLADAKEMSDSEVRAEAAELREFYEAQAELAAQEAADPAEDDSAVDSAEDGSAGDSAALAGTQFDEFDEFEEQEEPTFGDFMTAFVMTMFHPLDLLFIALALGSAFKIGSGGIGQSR